MSTFLHFGVIQYTTDDPLSHLVKIGEILSAGRRKRSGATGGSRSTGRAPCWTDAGAHTRRFPRSTRNSGTRTRSHIPPPSVEQPATGKLQPRHSRQREHQDPRTFLFDSKEKQTKKPHNTPKSWRRFEENKLAFKREELTPRLGGLTAPRRCRHG